MLNDYNRLEKYKLITYNIISYLMDNNENIWKLLKYDKNDALDQPNLTKAEKGALIYNGEEDSEEFKVFRNAFPMDDAFESQVTHLRIFPTLNDPENRLASVQDIMFCPVTHVKLTHLNDYTTRLDTIVEEIISTLNGASIEGLGQLFYDGGRRRTNSIRYVPSISNNKNFDGVYITMSVNLMTVDSKC